VFLDTCFTVPVSDHTHKCFMAEHSQLIHVDSTKIQKNKVNGYLDIHVQTP